MLDSILVKLDRTARKMGDMFPHVTELGRWRATTDGSWTGGYWVGLLWLAYAATKCKKYRRWARKWELLLARRRKEQNPDLGHLFCSSFVLGHLITGDEKLRKIAFGAADTLTTCFNEKSGFIYKEIDAGARKAGRALVDYMMNLPLLWWAHKETDNERYYEIAEKHSVRTLEELVRDDGSTSHVVDFDLNTGRIIRKATSQGYNADSCWSRGQAWAVYGFSLAYEATQEEKLAKIAEKLADYFIENLPADNVPYWDFNAPRTADTPKDSSAAAIACSGLMTLSKLRGKRKFGNEAGRILSSLSTNYMAEESHDGILKHGCFHVPQKIGVDEGLVWGDYYFMEALMKSRDILKVVG